MQDHGKRMFVARPTRRAFATGFAAAMLAPVAARAQMSPEGPPSNRPVQFTAELKQLAPNVYAYVQIEAPGLSNLSLSNAGFIVCPEGLVGIDALSAPLQAQRFKEAAEKATGKKFKRLVITHHHPDHTGGLQFFADAELIAHEECRILEDKFSGGPPFSGFTKLENWSDGTTPFKLTLPRTTYSDRMILRDNPDSPIELYWPGPAHSAGDTNVLLPREKIIFIGDLGFFGRTPLNGSGYIKGWIEACDKVLAMDVRTIVPGHGPVGGKAELADMKGYLELIWREGKKRFDQKMSPGRAAFEIDLGKYKTWADPERIVTNLTRLWSEFDGTITPDGDRPAIIKAWREYFDLVTKK